jgi:hypothetical protein
MSPSSGLFIYQIISFIHLQQDDIKPPCGAVNPTIDECISQECTSMTVVDSKGMCKIMDDTIGVSDITVCFNTQPCVHETSELKHFQPPDIKVELGNIGEAIDNCTCVTNVSSYAGLSESVLKPVCIFITISLHLI